MVKGTSNGGNQAEEHDVIVLGAGVCGMAVATQLGSHAVVLERGDRAGGLVRSHRMSECWFDEVIHLLFFWDEATARLIRGLLGADLGECPADAWVETSHGVTRYPYQMHLGTLPSDLVARCLADIESVAARRDGPPPEHFKEVLQRSYGDAICESFLYPYNRKVWKRPLESLAPTGFQWNLPRVDLEEIRRGAYDPQRHYVAYNSHGHYPRPAADAPVRGMEAMSRALADRVHDLRVGHEVVGIDADSKTVTVRHHGVARQIRWRQACVSTMPLPTTLRACGVADPDFATLAWNRVVMVDMAVRGPRPRNTGLWRYFSDESIPFNRLVYMHEFDSLTSPPDRWGLMAEITEPAESPLGDLQERAVRCAEAARGVGALGPTNEVIEARARLIECAYVAFTLGAAPVIERARNLLRRQGITPLGRYGRWEYSSMAQVMRDGFSWGKLKAKELGYEAPPDLHWQHDPRPAAAP